MARPSLAYGVALDVSAEMAVAFSEKQSCLDRAREIASHILANMMREGKKKDLVQVMAFGTSDTNNSRSADNVVTTTFIGTCDKEACLSLDKDDRLVKTSQEMTSDIGAAIYVAQSDIGKVVGVKKYKCKIFILTNGRGVEVENLLSAAENGELDSRFEYVIVLIENAQGETENVKRVYDLADVLAKQNVRVISDKSMQEELTQAHIGTRGQIPCFRGVLQVGNDVGFHVHGYTKTSKESPPSLKKASKVALDRTPESRFDPAAAEVKRQNFYSQPDNPDEEVDPDSIVQGFRFGRQSIPFNATDESLRKYETGERKLDLIGFVPQDHVPPFYNMGKTDVFQAAPGLERSRAGLSAFIRAMVAKNMAAVCRYIPRGNAKVSIVALLPYVSEDDKIECLFSRELPFEQDLRAFAFESITEPKHQPGVEQLEAMKELICSMYIGGESDVKIEGVPAGVGPEQFIPENTLNPLLERIYRLLEARMKDPGCAVPRDSPEITRLYTPDPAVLARARQAAEKVKSLFPIKEIIVEKGSKRKGRDDLWGKDAEDGEAESKRQKNDGAMVGLVGLDEDEDDDGVDAKVKKDGTTAGGDVTSEWFGDSRLVEAVGSVDPIKDYEAMTARTDKDLSEEAFKGMCKQIDLLISSEATNKTLAKKGLDCLVALRKGSIKHATDESFNSYLREVKKNASKDFWLLVEAEGLSLITSQECVSSDVSPEEAKAFLHATAAPAPAPAPFAPLIVENEEDFEDLE